MSELITLPDKLFFKIGEISQLTGVKPHILRYWEQEFKFLRPQKNKNGQRIYQKQEVELILCLKELLYEKGYTIAGARQLLEQKRETGQGGGKDKSLSKFLKWQKQELQSLLKLLERQNHKDQS